MPRYIISGDTIEVAYGYDDMLGAELLSVFLQVFDKRLEYDKTASEEVNRIAEQMDSGCYFALRTGKVGTGTKVGHKTMAAYLKRFGVTQEQIESFVASVDPELTARLLVNGRSGRSTRYFALFTLFPANRQERM